MSCLAHKEKIKPAITNMLTPKDYFYCYFELNLTSGGGGGCCSSSCCLADPLCVSEKLTEQKPKKEKEKNNVRMGFF
jgi:hypothetical protein